MPDIQAHIIRNSEQIMVDMEKIVRFKSPTLNKELADRCAEDCTQRVREIHGDDQRKSVPCRQSS